MNRYSFKICFQQTCSSILRRNHGDSAPACPLVMHHGLAWVSCSSPALAVDHWHTDRVWCWVGVKRSWLPSYSLCYGVTSEGVLKPFPFLLKTCPLLESKQWWYMKCFQNNRVSGVNTAPACGAAEPAVWGHTQGLGTTWVFRTKALSLKGALQPWTRSSKEVCVLEYLTAVPYCVACTSKRSFSSPGCLWVLWLQLKQAAAWTRQK